MAIINKLRSAFIIVILLPILGLTAYGEESNRAVVIAEDVVLRESTNEESKVLENLSIGEHVEIISNKNNWYKLKLASGTTGWVFNKFIVPLDPQKHQVKKGIIRANNLNFREKPDLNSNILFQLSKDDEVQILDSKDNWYNVIVDLSKKGWVYSDYVEVKLDYPLGQLIDAGVNLRKKPSLDGDIIDKLNLNSYVYIKDYRNSWYNVLTTDNKVGWIYKEVLNPVIEDKKTLAVSRSASRISIGIIKSAKELLGKPYVYGAEGPSSFDCSGFTYYLFKKYNINLPRTAREQSTVGTKISRGSLQMADLIFFDTSGSYNGEITHVGIYIGGGKFIHASSGKNSQKVVISNLNEGYYKSRFVVAKRVV
jgi:uncharacterized protein YgiM (DUF1202 family)